jgi:hypothetical protein
MNRTLIGLYALLWLFAAGRAWSQSADEVAADPNSNAKEAAAPAAATTTGLYEEVEILRRLLNRELDSAYGLPAHGMNQALFAQTGNAGQRVVTDGHQQMAAEGVYVKGCGVVYSATLAPPSRPLLPQAVPAVVAPPTAWDQARAELRGEKRRPPEENAAARQASLTESILRLLAENGRHFRHLADNESITVALTFRRGVACTHCHAANWASTAASPYKHPNVLSAASASQPNAPVPVETTGRNDPEPYANEILTGDLHVRQRRLDAAVQAYTGALHTLSQALNREKERHGVMEVKTLLASVEVANKLAQVHTALGRNEEAMKFLEVARKSAQWAEERAGQGKPGTGAGVPLPSRLVVTVPKKVLEGAGKMTFEDFRKAASVEYLTFRAADKPDQKAKP